MFTFYTILVGILPLRLFRGLTPAHRPSVRRGLLADPRPVEASDTSIPVNVRDPEKVHARCLELTSLSPGQCRIRATIVRGRRGIA